MTMSPIRTRKRAKAQASQELLAVAAGDLDVPSTPATVKPTSKKRKVSFVEESFATASPDASKKVFMQSVDLKQKSPRTPSKSPAPSSSSSGESSSQELLSDVHQDNDVEEDDEDADEDHVDEEDPEAVAAVLAEDEDGTPWLIADKLTLLERVKDQFKNVNRNKKWLTCAQKIDWNAVAFGEFTPDQCEYQWEYIHSKVRKYRTMEEVLTDAIIYVRLNKGSTAAKKKMYPDMPSKPLSGYLKFSKERWEAAKKKNPNVRSVTDIAKVLGQEWRDLPDKKREKYNMNYQKELEAYKTAMNEFHEKHPELKPTRAKRSESDRRSRSGSDGVCRRPFNLYVDSQIEKKPLVEGETRKDREDKLKNKWTKLTDGKKIKYIREAFKTEIQYRKYLRENPSTEETGFSAERKATYRGPGTRSVLSAEERKLYDAWTGRPEKVAQTGYSYFCSMLFNSGEVKNLPQNEKLSFVAQKWKDLTFQERDAYDKEAEEKLNNYNKEFQTYLEGLEEDERNHILQEEERKGSKAFKPPKKRSPVKDPNLLSREAQQKYLEKASQNMILSDVAYSLFKQSMEKELMETSPEMTLSKVLKKIQKKWNKKMTPEEKIPWFKEAETKTQIAVHKGKKTKTRIEIDENEKEEVARILSLLPKDPPQSGYNLFQDKELQTPAFKNINGPEMMKKLNENWKSLPDSIKKSKFNEVAQKLKEEFPSKLEAVISKLSTKDKELYSKYLSLSVNRSQLRKRFSQETKKGSGVEASSDDDLD